MKAILAIVTFTAASLCGSAHAQQNVALRDWSNFCLATHGDTAAIARADAAGWRSDDLYAQDQMATGQFEAVAIRYSVDMMNRRHVLAVLTFRPQTRGNAQVQNVQCIVSYPTGSGPLREEVETLLGFPQSWSDQGSSVWALVEDGGPMRPVPNDPTEARAFFESHQTALVRVYAVQGLDIVMFERTRAP